MRWIEIIVLILVFNVFCFAQTTWNVPDDFTTIQGAISDPSVLSGNVVIVRAGTYFENIDFLGKNIAIMSESGPELTVIDGSVLQLSVVTFQSGEGKDAILEGFTITNGFGTLHLHGNPWGGGVFCLGSSPTIRHNIIDGNTAYFGGGIGCESSSIPLIQHNEICNNKADGGAGIGVQTGQGCLIEYNYIHNNLADSLSGASGGGIYAFWEGCKPIIRNNRIENNYASTCGGGIYIGPDTEATIYGNQIMSNEAHGYGGGGINLWSLTIWYGTYSHVYNNLIMNNISTSNEAGSGGGAIYSRYESSFIYNNTLIGNQAYRGGGLYVLSYSHVKPYLSNSILWDNTANSGPEIYLHANTGSAVDVEYCDIKRGWPGTGNIDADPLFVDPSNGDYHLTFNSPCKDIGNNSFPYVPLEDFEGNPRIAYGVIDMGADEYSPHLYYTGDAVPSGSIQAKFVGFPGNWIDAVIMGYHIFEQPLPCDYGVWYLNDPMQIITGLGKIPVNGVVVIPGTVHPLTPTPSTLYLQAAIDSWLTNLCPVNIE